MASREKPSAAAPAKPKAARVDSVLVPATEDLFRKLGGEIMGRDPEGRSEKIFMVRWMSFFGVSPLVCLETRNLIGVTVDAVDDLASAKPEHLLWALLFLKKYGDESEMARLVGADRGAVDEKTFRKWSKIFIIRIACLVCDVVSLSVVSSISLVHLPFITHTLLQIVWENRKKGDKGNDCLVSVDGTDCHIPRQNAARNNR